MRRDIQAVYRFVQGYYDTDIEKIDYLKAKIKEHSEDVGTAATIASTMEGVSFTWDKPSFTPSEYMSIYQEVLEHVQNGTKPAGTTALISPNFSNIRH